MEFHNYLLCPYSISLNRSISQGACGESGALVQHIADWRNGSHPLMDNG